MTDFEEYQKSELGEGLDSLWGDLRTIKFSGNKKTDIAWILDRLDKIKSDAYEVWKQSQKSKVVWVKGKVIQKER